MNVIIYRPTTNEKTEVLSTNVAKVYATAVQNIVENLKCSRKQKLKILYAILEYKRNNLY